MSTPLACLLAYIKTDVTMAAINGGRVSENQAPQRDAFPRIVLEGVGRDRDMTHDGKGDLQKLELRAQMQAKDKASPEAMRDRLTDMLNGFRGSLGGAGGITVHGAFEKGAPDEFEPAIDASENGVFIIAADYDVHYKLT